MTFIILFYQLILESSIIYFVLGKDHVNTVFASKKKKKKKKKKSLLLWKCVNSYTIPNGFIRIS